jgi:hypothetical protein
MAIETLGHSTSAAPLDWSVFPNPVQQYLYFTIVELPSKAEVISQDGKRFWLEINNGGIDLENLLAGTYIVRLHLNGCVQQSTFVKI